MSKFVKARQLSLNLSTGGSQNLKQLNQKLATEFNETAKLLRHDMDRIFTHFMAVEDIVEMGGRLTIDLEKLLEVTEQTVSTGYYGSPSHGMKEMSEGINREVVVEGGQKHGTGLLNAFDKVKRETKKLFDQRFFKGKEFGHQDITPSGIRLAAFAQALENLEKNLIDIKNPTKKGEGRVGVPTQIIQLKKQNIAELRKVKATIQKMLIGSALVEKMPMTKALKNAPPKTKYLELARVFNNTKNTQAILETEKKKFINLKAGEARIELKLEAKDYNSFKNSFQSPFGTNASRIFKGQNPSSDLTKYFINKVKIGKLIGSESIEDKIVKDISALAKGRKIKRQNTKTKVKSKAGKLNKRNKVNLTRKHKNLTARARKVSAKASRTTKTETKGKEAATENQDLFRLEKLINKRLPAEVRRNMGRPALRNQTSQFSNSAQLESLRQTAKGLSAEYTYQLSPYETFENTGIRRWPLGYNPKPLIAKSIRNLAMQYTEQKLVSLRRT